MLLIGFGMMKRKYISGKYFRSKQKFESIVDRLETHIEDLNVKSMSRSNYKKKIPHIMSH